MHYPVEFLRSLVPDADHPDLNAMRNSLSSPKISIPVHLLKDGREVYAADVFMFGHSQSLYQTALAIVLDDLGARKTGVDWDHVHFHNAQALRAKAATQSEVNPLAEYIRLYRKIDLPMAVEGITKDMRALDDQADPAKRKSMLDQNILRLCAVLIATSVELKVNPAYTPKPKGLLQRLFR